MGDIYKPNVDTKSKFVSRFSFVPSSLEGEVLHSLYQVEKAVKKALPNVEFDNVQEKKYNTQIYGSLNGNSFNWITADVGNPDDPTKEIIGYHIEDTIDYVLGAPQAKQVSGKEYDLPGEILLLQDHRNKDFGYQRIEERKKGL